MVGWAGRGVGKGQSRGNRLQSWQRKSFQFVTILFVVVGYVNWLISCCCSWAMLSLKTFSLRLQFFRVLYPPPGTICSLHFICSWSQLGPVGASVVQHLPKSVCECWKMAINVHDARLMGKASSNFCPSCEITQKCLVEGEGWNGGGDGLTINHLWTSASFASLRTFSLHPYFSNFCQLNFLAAHNALL